MRLQSHKPQLRRIISYLFFLLLSAFFASPIFGQWIPVLNVGSFFNTTFIDQGFKSGFFFDEFTGFVASSGDNVDTIGGNGIYIFKTTNGGKSWIRANISTPTSYKGDITQIFMTDTLNGWASIEEPANASHNNQPVQSLLKTTDGGLNWKLVGPPGYFSCVYQTPSALILTSRSLTASGFISQDDGTTFQPGIKITNGIDFVDNFHGVISGFNRTHWKKTLDGGITWTDILPGPAPLDTECWGIYGVKGTSIFYTCPETETPISGGHSNAYRSTDFGSTWIRSSILSFYSTGAIGGYKDAVLYAQVQDDISLNPDKQDGMFRSTDQGSTWTSIGGPRNRADTRFVVTGCNGGVVYAFDKNNTVWKTRNGGDGGVYEPPLELQVFGNPVIFSGPICSTSYGGLQIGNLYCKEDTILSAEIADTTSVIISSGALTISGMTNLPLLLNSGATDSLHFTWQPSKIFHSDTTVTVKVRLKYFSKALQQIFDTIVTVSVHAIGAPPSAEVTPINAAFGRVSLCNPHDTLITIRNTGCDTLFITKANLGVSPSYSVTNLNGSALSLPIIIPPDSIGKIDIHLKLGSSGNYSGNLVLTLKHQGISRDTSLAISANGIVTPGKYVSDMPTDTLFDLKLTRCDTPKTFTIHLSNPECDKIKIISAVLEPLDTPNIVLAPASLPQDLSNFSGPDSLPLSVTVSPILLGSYSGKLHIQYQTSDGKHDTLTHDTLMSYFLTVGYGSRLLSMNVDTIDLGTMKLCDARDSAVLAKDIGCDSLLITGLQIQGDGMFTLTGNPKLNLSAQQVSRIPFHFDPIGAGNISGILTVSTISDSMPVRTIVILAHVTPTDTVNFNMLPTDSCFFAGDTMTVRLVPQKDILGKGLKSVSFVLHYNGDLLTLENGLPKTFIPGTIAGTSTPSGTPKNTTVLVTLSSISTLELPANQPVLELRFVVSLTDSITTTFDLTDIKLNGPGGDTIFQRCELGILSASLSYSLCYRCGDSLLVKFMQLGNNLNIFTDAVYPNPLSDRNDFQAILPFSTNTKGIFHLAIYDNLGREQSIGSLNSLLVERPGKYYFPLDGRNLPGGFYYYLLQSDSSVSARGRFIIAK